MKYSVLFQALTKQQSWNTVGRTRRGGTKVDGGRVESFKRLQQTFCGPIMPESAGQHSQAKRRVNGKETEGLFGVHNSRITAAMR